VGVGELDDHRAAPTAAAAAEAAATGEATTAEATAATTTEIAAATAPATTFNASRFGGRAAPRASVVENARESDSDEHRNDGYFSHDAEMSLVPPITPV
jgi:hypothetical protein